MLPCEPQGRAELRAAIAKHVSFTRAIACSADDIVVTAGSQRPLDALQTLDRDERVFYVGTFSKVMFPNVRIGYIVTPPWAHAALIAAKQITDRHTAIIMQDPLTAFLTEGHLVRHVRKMTRVYAARRARLLAAIARHCPQQLEPIPSEAGLHITAKLLVPAVESTVLARAAEAGIKVQAVSEFAMGKVSISGLGFGYGGIADADIEPGARLLASVISRVRM